MKAIAPGKIILSGEHAVVFGQPALVMAVSRFAVADVRQRHDTRIEIITRFGRVQFAPEDLASLLIDVRGRFDQYRTGTIPISKVLHNELEYVALGWPLLKEQFDISAGLSLQVISDLPVGSGMGSSAATAVAVLHALARSKEQRIDPETCYSLALELENFQHGHSSGADPYVAVYGGLIRFQKDIQPTRLPTPDSLFHLVNTGPPETTTGECVDFVHHTIGKNTIWNDFRAVCGRIESALINEDPNALCEAVRFNHQLLLEIGVVPVEIADWIASVELAGGAAKICGAGSIRGSSGGIVWVVGTVPDPLIQSSGFTPLDVQGHCNGTIIID